MRLRTLFLLGALIAWFGKDGKAQTTQINADCRIPFQIDVTTAPANVPLVGYSNKVNQCGTWVLSYQAPTTVTGISIVLQSASDTAGSAGTFGTFSGTTITGSNPSTTIPNSFYVVQGNPAWVRVHLTSASGSGSVTGYAYGWIIPPQVYTSSSGGGGPTSNVNVAQYGGTSVSLGQTTMSASMPVAIASDQSTLPDNLKQVGSTNVPALNGALGTLLSCPNTADVALSGTSYTQIVAASGSTVIYVCNMVWTSATGGSPVVNTFNVAFGTCASSPTEALQLASVTGYTDTFGGSLRSGAGGALCAKESTANSDHVSVTYAQF